MADKTITEAMLKTISDGDIVLGEISWFDVRRSWSPMPEAKCRMCNSDLMHTRQSHNALLHHTMRILNRTHRLSKVPFAERVYRDKTGKDMTMEEILWHEMGGKEYGGKYPPTSATEMSGILECIGVDTVLRWCSRLGVPIIHRGLWWRIKRGLIDEDEDDEE